ncbi:MAG TPA: hypothetical protein VFL69_09460 [Marmoricola sp.]|nr:hypothetical protein [Marmoricola sp.]
MATMHAGVTQHVAAAQNEVVTSSTARKALAALRIAFGLTFLWAFFDKLLALGYHTGWDQTGTKLDRFGPAAWYNGGSPTKGFLSSVDPNNWFHGAYTSIAGAAWADWLFMIGLLGIGLALTLGAGMRIAAISGVVLYVLMWAASFPLETNPVIDDHVLGAISVVVLALTLAGDTWGLGRWWSRIEMVRRYPILR